MENLSILRGEPRALPSKILLHKYFEELVTQNRQESKRRGIYFQRLFLSYADFNAKANYITKRLKGILDERNTVVIGNKNCSATSQIKDCRIAVDIEPSHTLLIAILAILKLDGAYVPTDASSAINRVRYLINEVLNQQYSYRKVQNQAGRQSWPGTHYMYINGTALTGCLFPWRGSV